MNLAFRNFVKDNKLHELFGLLTCEQLKRMRRSLNVTYETTDKYLGFKPGTYRKYELGLKLQTKEVDNYIRQVFLHIAPIAVENDTRTYLENKE